MSKQAPAFTVKMSTFGCTLGRHPHACVYGFGVYLNAISRTHSRPRSELGALTVIYVWITIFAAS